MKKTLTLLRGISGSGKSTYIRNNYNSEDVVVCSADHYFLTSEGAYEFDPRFIGDAHTACYTRALKACAQGKNVIIDNTNTHMWEASPYVMLANAFEMTLEIVRVHCPAAIASARNIHGVPADAIEGMEERMENFPPFWAEEKLVVTHSQKE